IVTIWKIHMSFTILHRKSNYSSNKILQQVLLDICKEIKNPCKLFISINYNCIPHKTILCTVLFLDILRLCQHCIPPMREACWYMNNQKLIHQIQNRSRTFY
ncbi:unnamed protein product, partial [Meganyctiphanes norvegica]